MDLRAIALHGHRWGTYLATGVRPLTIPPVIAVRPQDLRHKLLYLVLHGAAGDNRLRDDFGNPVLDPRDIESAGLHDLQPIVYMAGCFGSPYWTESFLEAGAVAVVADSNEAWAGKRLPLGSHAIGWLWLRGLRRGKTVGKALDEAKATYGTVFRGARDREMLDTLHAHGDVSARW